MIIEIDDQPANQRKVCIHEKKMENFRSFLLSAIAELYNMVLLYARVSNSSRSEGQIRTCKVTRGPHYDHQMVVDVNVLQCLVCC